ncbi:hypothetical protein jhhlp_003292 [Lomentospora prolificans]|uniref:Uncharacterized protein n=1 Tax=Lomentospora prolificans TaxID=41688 RepID=A0A2N3NGJ7_9PEZI|nr:hypothetical protein jhhlp_003292 [Lomentospora prolificans]
MRYNPMNSFFTVNNHVSISLLSVTVTPSTFLAAFTISLLFISIYLSFYLAPISAATSAVTAPFRRILSVVRPKAAAAPEPTAVINAPATIPLGLQAADHQFLIASRRPLPALPPPQDVANPDTALVLRSSRRYRKKVLEKELQDEHDGSSRHASLQDFEPTTPLRFGYPSHHSGFRSEGTEESDGPDSVSAGGYSPPAWRRLENGDRSNGFWRKSDNILGHFPDNHHLRQLSMRSGIHSPYESEEEDDNDVLEQAIRTRLPTGSLSPEKGMSPEPERTLKMDDIVMTSPAPAAVRDTPDNYIRFAVRAEVQHRTEPIDAAIRFARTKVGAITRSWTSLTVSILVALVSVAAVRSLFQPASNSPVPDLVKVAGLARSFEPLIYYSENGVAQVGDLQATSVAVWDLGESVRSSNMTSASIIVKELDDLSDSLKTLAIELTKFFANVDGDIDGILIVMDWARRELTQVRSLPSQPLSSALDNVYLTLSHAGILESPDGTPTPLGALVTSLFGRTNSQRTRQTLQRTFTEFLSVLEDSINSELQASLAIFALFEAIDQQFLNLARAVVRESTNQDEAHADLLSSLWTRILGPRAAEVAKYERNRDLLRDVRDKTVRNKGILLDHNHKLLALKANLESLRRKLVSPLVRSVNSSTLTVEEQIRGLEDVGGYLEDVRKRQKGKLMEMVYGASAMRSRLIDERA